MSGEAWSGADLLGALRHASAMLQSQVDEVNALNVFPVPDGDTGSNMLATIQSAIAEAETLSNGERSVPRVGSALSLGALMGARGNSGVILSQLFRGVGDAIAQSSQVGGAELAGALEQGSRAAFAAVAEPVEGTMLTVMRDASVAAARAAGESTRLQDVLAAAVEEAAESVKRTPSLLPVLRRAGVVDAGGRGIELLLRGALASVHANHLAPPAPLAYDLARPHYEQIEADGYGFETVFIVHPESGGLLDVGAIRTRLSELGQSVLVAGDEHALKIHIHNDHPDDVIAYGLSLGTLSRINVENLDRQASDVLQRAARGLARAPAETTGPQPSGRGVVAVAAGDGLAHVFGSLGVNALVKGGQGANPSAGELADAIRATGAAEVIVLPNNANVRLAAEQAGKLCPGVAVAVAPTRNAAEGVAALLALDAALPLEQAAAQMAQAARSIQTLQSTVAVRDARIGEQRVSRGDYIVVDPDEGLITADRDRTTAIMSALRTLEPGFELLTIYRGAGVGEKEAGELVGALRAEMGAAEVELVDGGQPHYEFLISAE